MWACILHTIDVRNVVCELDEAEAEQLSLQEIIN
jgi:hypothetical protein